MLALLEKYGCWKEKELKLVLLLGGVVICGKGEGMVEGWSW
jgi:hypothetical protein